MKVKIKKGRWFYKKMIGKVIDVEASSTNSFGVIIPYRCMNQEVFATVFNGKTYYVHPEDVEEIKKEGVQHFEPVQKTDKK